jgi:hypothetical protein
MNSLPPNGLPGFDIVPELTRRSLDSKEIVFTVAAQEIERLREILRLVKSGPHGCSVGLHPCWCQDF